MEERGNRLRVPRRLLIDLTPLRRSRDFRHLVWGELVSVLGNQLTTVAVPYQVYQLTRSSLAVGLVSIAQLFPLIAGSLLGGSVVDAMDRRRLLMAAARGLERITVRKLGGMLAALSGVDNQWLPLALVVTLLGYRLLARWLEGFHPRSWVEVDTRLVEADVRACHHDTVEIDGVDVGPPPGRGGHREAP